MIVETLFGIAIAVGIIGVVLILDVLVSRVSFVPPGVKRVTILSCEGEAEGLEGAVRDAVSRRGAVYILDSGMSPESVKRARLLALKYGASLLDSNELMLVFHKK